MSHPPEWPHQMFWCDACGEPADNNVVHDTDTDPPGCGGEVTTYIVGRIRPIKGTNGEQWEYAP